MRNDKQLSQMQSFSRQSKKVTWRTGNRVVAYTRVSSYEQATYNTSLDTQHKACVEFAERRGLIITDFFGGTYESAKNDERKQFKKMLDFVRRDKSISAILVYSYERFSRSENAGALTRKLEAMGIKVLSVFQDVDVTTPSGKLQQNIFYLFGNYDNELRKDKVIKGMVENLRKGYWVSEVPFGYTNNKPKHKAKEHVYVINKDGELLKQAFKWKAEGKLNNLEIVEKMQKMGSTINYKSFVRIISNPFYCGYVTHSLIPGEVYKGHHPPLISEALFLKANEEVSLNPHKGIAKKQKIDELPLKSFAKDEVSLSPLTGYIQKGIYYYKARAKGASLNVRADHLNNLFKEELSRIEFDKKYSHELEELTREMVNEKLADRFNEQTQVKRKIALLREKQESLEMKFIEGSIDREMYEKYKAKFEQELAGMSKEINADQLSSSNLEKAIQKGLGIAQNAREIWVSSDYDDKQKLQYLIYPEGIWYNKHDDAVRTPKMNSFFSLIAGTASVLKENKNGRLSKSSRYSHWVVPTRIELVSKV